MRCILYRIGLKGAQSVIHLVTIFFAYLLTIAPAGYFRAWVAAKMGDETAKDNGFLTLNPINHIDPIGIIMLFLPFFLIVVVNVLTGFCISAVIYVIPLLH